MGEKYLTTEEFAEMARTAASTVRFWRMNGKLDFGVRRGRRVLYPLSAVEAFLGADGVPEVAERQEPARTIDPSVLRLAEAVTKLREAAGINQYELADAVGLSKSQISRLENGATEPPISKLVLIAEFFGLTVGQLLDGDTGQAARVPDVIVTRSVTCEEHGIVGSGLTPEKARQIQADHRREHLALSAEGGGSC